MINPFKFYRLDFCFRNLGLGVIGILSTNFPFWELRLPFISLLNILLIQMHSFSMNDYFDFKIWGEENYVGKIIKKGIPPSVLLFLTLLPLIILSLVIIKYKSYSFLLFTYVILFYFYQAPPFRLKNCYLCSLIINAICLGAILYLYPYLFVGQKLDSVGIFFTIIFFIYLMFHELIHQIAHLGRDKIYSLPSHIGIKGTVTLMRLLLIIVIMSGIVALYLDFSKHKFFLVTFLFCGMRLYKLSKFPLKQGEFLKLRERWHKFYTLYEGLFYIGILLWK